MCSFVSFGPASGQKSYSLIRVKFMVVVLMEKVSGFYSFAPSFFSILPHPSLNFLVNGLYPLPSSTSSMTMLRASLDLDIIFVPGYCYWCLHGSVAIASSL